ncbi:MAG: biotin/lipoate A/B protein ligase family protein [Acidimicrobiia bacterium]
MRYLSLVGLHRNAKHCGAGTLTDMPDRRLIRLLRSAHPERAGLDTAISHALLAQVGSGEVGETLRLFVPGRVVAFGRQDTSRPGYPKAANAAREAGFAAVERLAGGRAALFHEATLAFAWAIPEAAPRATIRSRFQEIAEIMAGALKALGIGARIGEVPNEYCPGPYSVSAGGKRKLMGVGQRLVRRAAHVGGVVVVGGSGRVRDVLIPVYAALDYQWDPATSGSIEDEVGPIGLETVAESIISEFEARYELVEGGIGAETLRLAEQLRREHLSPGELGAGRANE